MLLVERGDVVLADRVQRYLPEFEGEHKEKARVWHLLSHVSGLPDQVPQNRELRRTHAPLSQFVAAALRTPLFVRARDRVRLSEHGHAAGWGDSLSG